MTHEEMWKEFCNKEGIAENTAYEAWSFGGDPDGLAGLVLSGIKTATASADELYEICKEERPEAGAYSVVLKEDGEAVCVIRNTKAYCVPFDQVSEEHAFKEGEGNRSLTFWKSVHEEFFRECLSEYGLSFREDMPVWCEEFEVLYPKTECRLISPTMEWEEEITAFRNDFLTLEGSMDGCGSLKRMEKISDWIAQVESLEREETCPSNFVPCSQFIYVREADKKILGVLQIRHRFNEFLEKYAGHIGYSVCPSERRKGYATRMLKDALPVCRSLGIDPVCVSCLTDNEGSRKTILNNGGKYVETVTLPDGAESLDKYVISLKQMKKELYL